MLFGLFNRTDINKGVEEWKAAKGAVLLDVRTKEEYREGHIDGSINIPQQELNLVMEKIPDKNTQIFVHCYSGARSAGAERYLKAQGYSHVTNIGGIASYSGKLV